MLGTIRQVSKIWIGAAMLAAMSIIGCSGNQKTAEKQGQASQSQTMNPNQAMPDMMASAEANKDLHWTLPSGWQEQGGGGMRMATFRAGYAAGPVECSVTSLGGMAGGLAGNVRRWMGQLDMPDMADADLEKFLSGQMNLTSDGQLSVMLVDLNSLIKDQADSRPGMLVGVLTKGNSTVFLKLMGTKSALEQARPDFEKLCKSLRVEAPQS